MDAPNQSSRQFMNSSGYIPRPPLSELRHKAQWMSLLMLAIGLHVVESSLPGLGPWLKPGLANIITLIALVWMGPRAAISLAIMRVFTGSMLIGTMLTPTFVMSLSGAVAAVFTMLFAWRFIPGISLIGVSLSGALAHMGAQFVAVETLFIQQSALYHLLPPFLIMACVTGWVNGMLAMALLRRARLDG